MNKNLMKWLAVPAMLALLGQGCGGSTSGTVGTNTGSTGSPVAGTTGGSGRCVNAYYPLEAATSIDYKTMSNGEVVPLTIAVLEHDADGIVLEYTFTIEGREVKIKNELECVNGTIRGKGHFDMASAFLPFQVEYDVLSMSGEIMPADVRVGSEWDMETEVKMITADTSIIGRTMNGTTSRTSIHNKVVGEESVTVPAGTYRALKIEQTVEVQTTIMGRPTNSTVNSVAWYVKDVGLVKSQQGTGSAAFSMEATAITR